MKRSDLAAPIAVSLLVHAVAGLALLWEVGPPPAEHRQAAPVPVEIVMMTDTISEETAAPATTSERNEPAQRPSDTQPAVDTVAGEEPPAGEEAVRALDNPSPVRPFVPVAPNVSAPVALEGRGTGEGQEATDSTGPAAITPDGAATAEEAEGSPQPPEATSRRASAGADAAMVRREIEGEPVSQGLNEPPPDTERVTGGPGRPARQPSETADGRGRPDGDAGVRAAEGPVRADRPVAASAQSGLEATEAAQSGGKDVAAADEGDVVDEESRAARAPAKAAEETDAEATGSPMGQTEAGEQAHPAVASAPAGQDTALNEEGREAGGADGVDAVASTAEEAAGPERPSGGLGAALRAALENSPATTAPATAGEAGGSAVPSSYAEAVRSAVAPGFFDAVRTVSGSGMVLVAVVIRRDGKVMSARVVNGSGNPALDAASLSAARAAPYPPLPRSVDRSALTVHIPLRVR